VGINREGKENVLQREQEGILGGKEVIAVLGFHNLM